MPKAKVTEIAIIQEKMAEIDQFSPLFDDEPNEELYSNILGDVIDVEFGGNSFKSLELKNGGKTARVPMVRGAETKTSWNIGVFTALRDYVSASGRAYKEGETQRVFAY